MGNKKFGPKLTYWGAFIATFIVLALVLSAVLKVLNVALPTGIGESTISILLGLFILAEVGGLGVLKNVKKNWLFLVYGIVAVLWIISVLFTGILAVAWLAVIVTILLGIGAVHLAFS